MMRLRREAYRMTVNRLMFQWCCEHGAPAEIVAMFAGAMMGPIAEISEGGQ
jgi:hypothetical protein